MESRPQPPCINTRDLQIEATWRPDRRLRLELDGMMDKLAAIRLCEKAGF
jgi:hypothetical protein